MKCFVLHTGPGGMTLEAARGQMLLAKRQCGNVSQGKLTLTRPDDAGGYYAIFENDRHGTAFQRLLDRQRTPINYEVLDSLPEGATLQEVPAVVASTADVIITQVLHGVFDPEAIRRVLGRRDGQ